MMESGSQYNPTVNVCFCLPYHYYLCALVPAEPDGLRSGLSLKKYFISTYISTCNRVRLKEIGFGYGK